MIAPPSPCRSIASRAKFDRKWTDFTFVSMIESNARSSISWTGP